MVEERIKKASQLDFGIGRPLRFRWPKTDSFLSGPAATQPTKGRGCRASRTFSGGSQIILRNKQLAVGIKYIGQWNHAGFVRLFGKVFHSLKRNNSAGDLIAAGFLLRQRLESIVHVLSCTKRSATGLN